MGFGKSISPPFINRRLRRCRRFGASAAVSEDELAAAARVTALLNIPIEEM